jgi:hypothetical protein
MITQRSNTHGGFRIMRMLNNYVVMKCIEKFENRNEHNKASLNIRNFKMKIFFLNERELMNQDKKHVMVLNRILIYLQTVESC